MSDFDELNTYKCFLENKIKLGESLKKLRTNEDFKMLVKAYTEDEPLRCLFNSISPSMNKELSISLAQASMHFKQYLVSVENEAADAIGKLELVEERIQDLMKGE